MWRLHCDGVSVVLSKYFLMSEANDTVCIAEAVIHFTLQLLSPYAVGCVKLQDLEKGLYGSSESRMDYNKGQAYTPMIGPILTL